MSGEVMSGSTAWTHKSLAQHLCAVNDDLQILWTWGQSRIRAHTGIGITISTTWMLGPCRRQSACLWGLTTSHR
jgi:hypothetical protein